MSEPGANHRVGIVGAGASGLATARDLLRLAPGRLSIDLFDARTSPFGLILHGVAPDHAKPRQLMADLGQVFDAPGVRFLGGVEMGRDVTRDDLLASYDAVVYATGAPADRLLDIPGEQLAGVRSGRAFAEWYTGTPGAEPFDLTGVTQAVIVGLGDVAVDLARVLLKNPDEFADTPMPADVVEHLRAHRVRDVTILVRRGPGDCQLKARDLDALLNLPGVAVRFDKTAVDVDQTHLSAKAAEALPIWRAAAGREHFGAKARLRIKFWTRPVDFRGHGSLEGVRVEKTQLDKAGRLVTAPGDGDHLPVQLVLRATGARGLPLPGVPFDARLGVVPTKDHRVTDAAGVVAPGEYAVGWLAHGWVGGFGTQTRNGAAAAARILADLDRHSASIDDVLAGRGVRPVGIEHWRRSQGL